MGAVSEILASGGYGYIKDPRNQQPMAQANPTFDALLGLMAQPQRGGGGGGGGGGMRLPAAGGAWDELMIEQPGEGYSTGLHLHGASSSLPLKRIARWAENKGFTIGGLEGYGGVGQVTGGHSPNSRHYVGEAFDANYYGGGRWKTEDQALDWLLGRLQTRWS